jgi:hypothetical protein
MLNEVKHLAANAEPASAAVIARRDVSLTLNMTERALPTLSC